MLQRISHLPILNLYLTKFVFLLKDEIHYYKRTIRAAIATAPQKNRQKTPIKGFVNNNAFIVKLGSDLDRSTEVKTNSAIPLSRSIVANLEKDFTSIPDYNSPLKIMPLGDSITYGAVGINNQASGGYRTELWNKFIADGLQVEFVGSLSDGPDSLSSRSHEGHPKWKIGQIAASVNEWLNTSQPDLILLMIGTNDTKSHSLRRMVSELRALIDQITAQLPDAQLLVASIPPIHPALKPPLQVLRALYFNVAIPGIVHSKVAQGKKVTFVDMRDLTVDDLTASISLDLDNGLHPNAQGYRKIASFWHDAVLKVISRQSTAANS